MNLDERVPGASGAAVPIFGPGGRGGGGAQHIHRHLRFLQSRETIVAALRTSAARITGLLGGTPAAGAPVEQKLECVR